MIDTIHLFKPLDKKLIALLRSLGPEEWEKPSIARQWNVKDVAAHLLDGNIRSISSQRDHYQGINAGAIHSFEDLIAFLNRINADWVTAMKRVSPAMLTEGKWRLSKTNDLPVAAHTTIEGSVAWKLFTKSWRRKYIAPYISIEGDTALGEVVPDMIAVMA
jgi:hypothetical protein